jgi:hypothetical protein
LVEGLTLRVLELVHELCPVVFQKVALHCLLVEYKIIKTVHIHCGSLWAPLEFLKGPLETGAGRGWLGGLGNEAVKVTYNILWKLRFYLRRESGLTAH